MADWEQPHWSGRPQPAPARLKPNGFARLARFCVRNPWGVILGYAVICAIAAVYAGASLRLDPAKVAVVALDPQTTAAEQGLARRFPDIDDVFVAKVAMTDPVLARQTALAAAEALRQETDLFESVDVPGTSPYYRKYGMLYLDLPVIQQRVRRAEGMQALLSALQAAPNLSGLAAFANQIDKALGRGNSPRGFAPVIDSVAASVESELGGQPRAVDWVRLAGLSGEAENAQWYVVATPKPGREAAAGAAARGLAPGNPQIVWTLPTSAQPRAADTRLQMIVPAVLSALVFLIVLAAGFGRAAPSLAVTGATLACLTLTAGVQALVEPQLDAARWSFAGAVLTPSLLLGMVLSLAYEQARAQGLKARSALMLAAQHHGLLLCGLAAIGAAFWAAWLPRAVPSLVGLAGIAMVAIALALAIVLSLVPAILALADSDPQSAGSHWIDIAAETRIGPNMANAVNVAVLLLLAFAAFSAVFVTGLHFGDRPKAAQNGADADGAPAAVHFLAADAAAAQAIVTQLGKLPEVGSIHWIEQFLPDDIEAKIAALSVLEGYLLPAPDLAVQPPPPAAGVLQSLTASLVSIAESPAAEPALRKAAQRLAKALAEFSSPTPAAVAGLEDRLFAGLDDVAPAAADLARLAAPQIADLDPALLRRFIAADGAWRIEVLPRPGIGRLSFAAAMRKVSPAVAGRPVIDLTRNEIMHHEAGLAMAMAFGAAALLALAVLRNPVDWIVSQVALALFVGLCAAAVVLSGGPADPAIVAAAMSAFAMCLSASILHLLRLRDSSSEPGASPAPTPSFRAGLLPPLAMAGILFPLAASGDAAVAHFGLLAGLFNILAVLMSVLAVPQIGEWTAHLRRG